MPRSYTTLTCTHCGADFPLPTSDVKRGRGLYCSRKCRSEHDRWSVAERLWSKVEKTDTCWLWQGYTMPKGYGVMNLFGPEKGRSRLVHRISYELHFGAIEDASLEVCHSCDVPACVRPDHLFLGTHKENQQDMGRKGRSHFSQLRLTGDLNPTRTRPECLARGTRNGNAKLNPEKVAEIRLRYAQGESTTTIAVQFGVSRPTIDAVVKRKTWK